uniref:Ovule protein n=1 Tax=Caenorhabditis tropicalis TaxID=1561998 RepID=A0A1I7U2V9_9PELO
MRGTKGKKRKVCNRQHRQREESRRREPIGDTRENRLTPKKKQSSRAKGNSESSIAKESVTVDIEVGFDEVGRCSFFESIDVDGES